MGALDEPTEKKLRSEEVAFLFCSEKKGFPALSPHSAMLGINVRSRGLINIHNFPFFFF